ncbi:MAG TPA: VOC family protein [Candidatus Sulfotelmatobacter sp.]|nr:VOC family protein [Candidatus Sulfotelmatobacter sp.]
MSQELAPRLSHVGLYVSDVPKMIDFYTRVLGFVVSDAAEDGRISFLSRNPSDHHQVVLVRGRATDLETPMVQQVSFNVGTLANVQRAFRKVRAAGCQGIDPICHGNAWSVYFRDPEGNRIEMFCDTPWYVPQPLGFKIDLDKPEDELHRETEAVCRAKPGFKPMEAWRAEIAQKIAAKLEA